MALHCTECGFLNGEGANYCQRCGALLERRKAAATPTGEPVTATYRIDEAGEVIPVEIDEVTARGPALVIRVAADALVFEEKGRSTLRFALHPDGRLDALWIAADGGSRLDATLHRLP